MLLPVARELMERGREIRPFAAGPAMKVLAGLPNLHGLDDAASIESVEFQFRHNDVSALLSASGLYNQIEHTARLAAARVGAPIVAVQDAWFNHDRRYERYGVASRPDLICVMDEMSRDEMMRVGFHPDKVLITGHPGLEATRRSCEALSAADITVRRRGLGVRDNALVLTFFSDPFYVGPNRQFYCGPGAIMRTDGRGLYGYTVLDVLPAFLSEIELALEEVGVDADLVVRPHPSECDEVVREIVSEFRGQRLRARVEQIGTTGDWLQVSDVVLGMMTIALLEAAVAERPAVSIELGLKESGEEDPCMAVTLGYAAGVFDRLALRKACQAIARQNWSVLRPTPPRPLQVDGAAGRIAACLLHAEASFRD